MHKLISIIFILLMTSCAVNRPQGSTEAEVLFKEAERLVKSERYIMALEKLNKIKSQYPYSYYATSAELMQADILYKQENFEEAAAAYLLFKDFHPKHPKMDYVTFKIAEAYYKQKPSTFDRDLTPAKQAIKYFNELRSLYPQSEYLKDAREKIDECYKMIKDKELYIANFYFKTKDWQSASFRYEQLLAQFSDDSVKKLASDRLVHIGLKSARPELCELVFKNYRYLYKDKDLSNLKKDIKKCME
ncbi:outer membrane protein assembly factor BamD [Bacteriovorax sp. BAL6_X]|uniref:outer membrane protein assembly factor BamD n=1 Tax=Bacteriovorax sp. BAL6_X TaxID=1201290 RepID=UPI000697871C|nr:outer membrane protein assembly factor BamD [Bacteriovorax sp. BAL6_X]